MRSPLRQRLTSRSLLQQDCVCRSEGRWTGSPGWARGGSGRAGDADGAAAGAGLLAAAALAAGVAESSFQLGAPSRNESRTGSHGRMYSLRLADSLDLRNGTCARATRARAGLRTWNV